MSPATASAAGMPEPSPSPGPDLARLRHGAARLQRLDHAQVADLAAACRRTLAAALDAWVAHSVQAKGWAELPDAIADEWAGGPVPVARFLHQLEAWHRAAHRGPLPPLPQVAPGVYRVPACPGLADPLLLRGVRVLLHGPADAVPGPPARHGGVALVLGAGNVTATPVLDVLDQVFRHGRAVLLKPSPLHAALVPTFAAALAPLLQANLLELAPGDAAVGRQLAHAGVDAVHLTGSSATWQTLCGDPALASTTLTGEVGCCTPALVVPGTWQTRDLQHLAAALANYVAKNGGGTCLAPRVLLTAARWPQRAEFLAHLTAALAATPARPPFHPSARAHWQTAAGAEPPAALPARLRTGLDAERDRELLQREHFAPVLLDWPLPAADAGSFLDHASGFVRDQVFGALSAYVLTPPGWRDRTGGLAAALRRLPHGTIAHNTWTGLGYGLGSVPWGAPPGAPIAAGRGQVHGATGLASVQQAVVTAPFRPWPTPPWLAPPARASRTWRALAQFYLQPTVGGLARTAAAAMLP